MTATTAANDRFLELDACRGIAAMAVALVHLILHYDIIFEYKWFSPGAEDYQGMVLLIGRSPIYFFFIISGYVISLTLDKVSTVREFAVFRFARLFPAYWAAIILTTFLLLLAPQIGEPPEIGLFAANFTMLQNLFGIGNVDPVYWSLAYELVFYLLIAAAFAWRRLGVRELSYFAAIWLAFSVIAFTFAEEFVKETPFVSHLLLYVPFFTGGIGFYLWRKGERNKLVAMLLLASMVAGGTRIPIFGLPAAITLFLCFYFVSTNKAKWLAHPWLLFLGRISYPVYLFHLAPGYLTVWLCEQAGIAMPFSVPLAVAVIIVCAFAIHKWIEEPARRKLRSFGVAKPKPHPRALKA